MATQVTPDEVRNTADEHLAADKDIENSMRHLEDVIGELDSRNDGDLMKALRNLQEGWNQEMTDVKKKLQEMAAHITKGANDLEAEMQAGAGELK